MAVFTLKRKEAKTLRVNIGENSFTIPLMGSLNWKEARLLESVEGTYSFFKKNVPEEIFESLSIDEYNELVNVWRSESEKASGKTQGES